MATVEDEESPSDTDGPAESGTSWWSDAALEHRFGVDRLTASVAGLVVVALFLRFAGLGGRIAHWDEARVALWILDYIETGHFQYRPIIHGPFYHHANKFLWGLFGANDFTMRIVPALVGGFLPLSALLFRERLRETEVLALAVFLAVNPLLLYYSRFMRGDILVGGFAFVALALFVRVIDTGRARYLFAGVFALGFAFAAKENALLYLATWVGGTVLVFDHKLLPIGERERSARAVFADYVRTGLRAGWRWLPWFIFAAFEFVLVVVYFYAPRAGDTDGLGLWRAFAQPSTLPAVIEAGTVGAWKDLWGLWVSGGGPGKEGFFNDYPAFLGDYLLSLGYGALALCLLALVGFVADRYSEGGPRDLVAFGFYCGVASILGYPLAADIKAPWIAVHAVLPLAFPAAVGLALVVRWARDAFEQDDRLDAGIAALLIVVIVGQIAAAGLWAVYLQPQSEDNEIVQYAQPGSDMRDTLHQMRAAAAGNDGTDVLVYGDHFASKSTSIGGETICMRWGNTLPLNWYFEIQNAQVDCAANTTTLDERFTENRPPVVVARSSERDVLRERFPEYTVTEHEIRTYGSETVFFVHPDYAPERGDS